MDNKIIELMAIPKSDHDLDWLKESLQSAIKLEFATLPPYLCALWSIKDESAPTYLSIRQHIAEEEMLHMGLTCNLLTAIGGVPIMNTPETVPNYPTNQLPGGIPLDNTLILRALSKDALKVFLEIEYPEFGPIARAVDETFPTIGDFYDAIQDAFDTIKPSISETNQLGGFLGLFKIISLDTVKRAIDLIKIQGEGTVKSPEEQMGDLAHYYRFGEIYYGKKLRKDEETGEWKFNGATVPFPDVWPMSEADFSRHLCRKDLVSG